MVVVLGTWYEVPGGRRSKMYNVKLTKLIDKMELENLTPDIDISEAEINQSEINRPALQLAGFFDLFDSDRVQIIGNVEYRYLNQLQKQNRLGEIFDQLFGAQIPCLIFCRDLEPLPEIYEASRKYNIPLLK